MREAIHLVAIGLSALATLEQVTYIQYTHITTAIKNRVFIGTRVHKVLSSGQYRFLQCGVLDVVPPLDSCSEKLTKTRSLLWLLQALKYVLVL